MEIHKQPPDVQREVLKQQPGDEDNTQNENIVFIKEELCDEANSTPSSSGHGGHREVLWTPDETRFLISTIKDNYIKLADKDGSCKGHFRDVWKDITAVIAEKKPNINVNQVLNKWKNLKHNYKRLQENRKTSSGKPMKYPWFYKEMKFLNERDPRYRRQNCLKERKVNRIAFSSYSTATVRETSSNKALESESETKDKETSSDEEQARMKPCERTPSLSTSLKGIHSMSVKFASLIEKYMEEVKVHNEEIRNEMKRHNSVVEKQLAEISAIQARMIKVQMERNTLLDQFHI